MSNLYDSARVILFVHSSTLVQTAQWRRSSPVRYAGVVRSEWAVHRPKAA